MTNKLRSEQLTVLPQRFETIQVNVWNEGYVFGYNVNGPTGGYCLVGCANVNTQLNLGFVNQYTTVTAVDLDLFSGNFGGGNGP